MPSSLELSISPEHVVTILGPTASQKSHLAFQIAALRPSQIVVCDAVMAYRGFNIGANKPTTSEQSQVPHHMLDLVDPNEPWSAFDYAQSAHRPIAEIFKQTQTPIITVGTYLYYRAMMYGLSPLPPPDETLRNTLIQKEKTHPGSIAAEVKNIDPASYQEANGRNIPRLIRALEVFKLTGQKASDLKQKQPFTKLRYKAITIALKPTRSLLLKRIEQRTAHMLNNGLIEEVQALRQKGVDTNSKPMQAIGYNEVNKYLSGDSIINNRQTLENSIIHATFKYAKRQVSFFKQENNIIWNECFGDELIIKELK